MTFLPFSCILFSKCHILWNIVANIKKKKITLELSFTEKKSHTCEKSGAHLRISFWHLWMNFEKPEKAKFWKNEKKMLEISSFYILHMWGTVPEIQSETKIFVILGHFLPFKPEKPKFWKNEKSIWRCHHFKLVQQKHNKMM